MSKFPEPPPREELARIAPAWRTLPADSLIWRIYFRASRHPTTWRDFRYWGPAGSRFDHHLPDAEGTGQLQDRGIVYAAHEIATCVAEVFQATRFVDRRADGPWLVGFRTRQDLRLLDLTGSWCTRIGASTAINSGVRARARRWSQALYLAFPEADGIAYASSMNGYADAYAFYERCRAALPATPSEHLSLDAPALELPLDRIARELGYQIV